MGIKSKKTSSPFRFFTMHSRKNLINRVKIVGLANASIWAGRNMEMTEGMYHQQDCQPFWGCARHRQRHKTGLPNMLLCIFCCNVPCLCTLCAQRINITDKCAAVAVALAFALFFRLCICVWVCVCVFVCFECNKKINGNVFHHECYLNAFLSIENLQFRLRTHAHTIP